MKIGEKIENVAPEKKKITMKKPQEKKQISLSTKADSRGQQIRELLDEGMDIKDIAKKIGVSEPAVYYHKRIWDAAKEKTTAKPPEPKKDEIPHELIKEFGRTLVQKVSEAKKEHPFWEASEIANSIDENPDHVEEILNGLDD